MLKISVPTQESIGKRFIAALDVSDTEVALRVAKGLYGHVGCFKLGLEFIYTMLGAFLEGTARERSHIHALFELFDGNYFLDSKLKDIPNTMKGAMKAIGRLSPRFVTVYADAGREGIRAAVNERGETDIIGVTVLTSFNERGCKEVYESASKKKDIIGYKVLQFADMLVDCGAQGVVCSPKELPLLRHEKFDDLIRVVPGTRPSWASSNDQKRVMTPAEALRDGADYLVIGRPITQPPDNMTPYEAVKRLIEETQEGMAEILSP